MAIFNSVRDVKLPLLTQIVQLDETSEFERAELYFRIMGDHVAINEPERLAFAELCCLSRPLLTQIASKNVSDETVGWLQKWIEDVPDMLERDEEGNWSFFAGFGIEGVGPFVTRIPGEIIRHLAAALTKPEQRDLVRLCPECLNPFVIVRGLNDEDKKYCSTRCATRRSLRDRRQKNRIERQTDLDLVIQIG